MFSIVRLYYILVLGEGRGDVVRILVVVYGFFYFCVVSKCFLWVGDSAGLFGSRCRGCGRF